MPLFSAIAAAAASVGAWFTGLTALAQFGVQLAVGVVFNAVGAALLAEDMKKPGISGQIGSGEDNPRSFILGDYATRGSLVYHMTWGKAGDYQNAYYTRVTALSDLPVSGLSGLWVDGRKCRLDWRREDPEKGVPLVEFVKPGDSGATFDDETGRWYTEGGALYDPALNTGASLKDYAWIKFHDGAQAVADDFLVNTVSNPAYPWDASAVGVGVAYAVFTGRINTQMFRGLPEIVYEVAGVDLENPVTGDTVPACGNPIIQACALVGGFSFGGQWLYGPQGPAAGRVVPDGLAAQIAACAVPVPGADAMTPEERAAAFGSDEIPARYRSGYEVRCDVELPDVLDEILRACNGRFLDLGDAVAFQVGDPLAPVAVLSDDDIFVTRPQSLTPFAALADVVNGVRAVYPEPSAAWEVQDAPPLYIPALETRDDGRRLPADLAFNAVPYAEQVQRLMGVAVLEARREVRHEIQVPAAFDRIEAGDFVEWNSARHGYAGALFRVAVSVPAGGASVSLTLVEADAVDYAAWDAARDFVAVVRDLVQVDPEPFQISGWSVAGGAVETDTRRGVAPALVISYPDVSGMFALDYRVSVVGTDEPAAEGSVFVTGAGSVKVSAGILAGVPYRVEVRGRISGGVPALWSDPQFITGPNIRAALEDLAADVSGAIDAAAQSAAADKAAAEGARDAALGYRDEASAARAASEGARDLALGYRDEAAARAAWASVRSGGNAFRNSAGVTLAADWAGAVAFDAAAPSGHPLGRSAALQLVSSSYYEADPEDVNGFISGGSFGRVFRFSGYCYMAAGSDVRAVVHSAAPSGPGFVTLSIAPVLGEWVEFSVDIVQNNNAAATGWRPAFWLYDAGAGRDAYFTDLRVEDVTAEVAGVEARDAALGYRDEASAARAASEGARDLALGYRDEASAARAAAEGARDLALGYRDEASATALRAVMYSGSGLIGKSVFDDGATDGWGGGSYADDVPAVHPAGRAKALRQVNRDLFYVDPVAGVHTLDASGRYFRLTGYCFNNSAFASYAGVSYFDGAWKFSLAALGVAAGDGWQYFSVTVGPVAGGPYSQLRAGMVSNGPWHDPAHEIYWTDLRCVDVTSEVARDQSEGARDLALGYRDGAQAAQTGAEGARDLALGYRDGAASAQTGAEGARDLALGYRDGAASAQAAAEGARDAAAASRDDLVGRLSAAVVFRDDGSGGLDLVPGDDPAAGGVVASRIGRAALAPYVTGARISAETVAAQSVAVGDLAWTTVQKVTLDPGGDPVALSLSMLLFNNAGVGAKFCHVRLRRGLLGVVFTTAGLSGAQGVRVSNNEYVPFSMSLVDEAGASGAQTYRVEVARSGSWSGTFEVYSAVLAAKVQAV